VKITGAKVVRLTVLGRAVRDAYRPLAARIEAGWRERYGGTVIDEVESAIRLADPLGLPAFPVVVWTGVEFAEAST
jgi:hypothetical protein